ncbi:MAG: HEAT repeat domain-containing protein [Phycisphaerae bacterium]|nr:HEAT repeat domain-containing protein [Phycisphaerae bacterium]
MAALIGVAVTPFGGCGAAQRSDGTAWSTKAQSASGDVTSDSEIPTPSHSGDEHVLARPASRSGEEGTRRDLAQRAGQLDPGAMRHEALEVARGASASNSAILRAHAIEALLSAPAELDSVVGRGLIDSNRGVRFVAAMAIAKTRRTELAHLVEPLLSDSSDSVRAAALAALAACGRNPDLSPLAAMVRSDNPEVRANAYLALGVIGNPSAIPLVRESIGGGFDRADPARVKVVDLQAAECLVRLGRSDDLEPIRAALFAPMEQSEVTALACQMIGRLKDAHSRPMLQRLIEAERESARPSEVRLAALEALGNVGVDGDRLLPILRPFVQSRSSAIRAQTCLALAATGSQGALVWLDGLLRDGDAEVRVAAASAILSLTTGERAWMSSPPPQRF